MGLIAAIITALSIIVDPTGGNKIQASSTTTVNATTKIVDPTGGNLRIVDPTGGN